MKKIFTIIALLALAVAPFAMASCAQNSQAETETSSDDTAVADGAGTETLEDINAGAEPAHQADQLAVIDLTNDDVVRPDMEITRLTVLDFNATWCGPCKQLTPVFDAAAQKYGNAVDFVSIDVDVNPMTAAAFKVQAVPTVVFMFPNGTSKTYVGTDELLPADKFNALVEAGIKVK